ncbi:MAG: hypothetical protein WA816_06920 [Bacteroidales bacterium]
MKSQVRFFLTIALISITFSSYGQVDLKKNVDAVQNGIKGVFKKRDITEGSSLLNFEFAGTGSLPYSLEKPVILTTAPLMVKS